MGLNGGNKTMSDSFLTDTFVIINLTSKYVICPTCNATSEYSQHLLSEMDGHYGSCWSCGQKFKFQKEI